MENKQINDGKYTINEMRDTLCIRIYSFFPNNFKNHYVVTAHEDEKNPVNQIWNLFKDKEGIIWAPNQAKSILKFNP